MASVLFGQLLTQKLSAQSIQSICSIVLGNLEKKSKAAIQELSEGYFFEDKFIPSMESLVGEDRTHILVMIWMNYKISQGSSLAELVVQIGACNFSEILDFLGRKKISEFGCQEAIQAIHFLNHLILNTDLESVREWIEGIYSQLVFLGLSKTYLKKFFIDDPSSIQIYQMLVETELSEDEKNAVGFAKMIVDHMMDTLGSLVDEKDVVKLEDRILLLEKLIENIFISLSLPCTRKSVIYLLEDRLFVIKIKLFKQFIMMKFGENSLLIRKLETVFGIVRSVCQSVKFGISGNKEFVRQNLYIHYDNFQKFQALIFNNFAHKIQSYAIKSVGNQNSREKLEEIFGYLSDQDLTLIANKLNIYLPTQSSNQDSLSHILLETAGFRTLVEECLIFHLVLRTPMLEQIKSRPTYPTERDIFQSQNRIFELESISNSNRSYGSEDQDRDQAILSRTATTSFDIERITLSYQNLEDYLLRHFHLFKFIFSLELRNKLETTVKMLNPKFEKKTGKFLEFAGWTQYSVEIQRFLLHDVTPLLIGESAPKNVLAEANYSLVESQLSVKQFWESLKEFDAVFLLLFEKKQDLEEKNEEGMAIEDDKPATVKYSNSSTFLEKYGLKLVRGAELQAHYDAKRNKINSKDIKKPDFKPKGFQRSLLLDLDHNQYSQDFSGKQEGSQYAKFNAAVRRDERDTNFKAYLKLILRHFNGDIKFDPWIEKVIIGERYSQELQQKMMQQWPEKFVDISSAFVDASCPESRQIYQKVLESLGQELMTYFEPSPTKKSTTSQLNYTLNQLQAISRSMLFGVSLIYGPPGTGKTDVCVEIVSQLFRNFPDERILLITHSNSALNDIFEKISASETLEKDKVIRLGMGHEKLNLREDFSKTGRINHFLGKRIQLLKEVEELAESLDPIFKMQFTCETADIFFKTQVLSRWKDFKKKSERCLHQSLSSMELQDFPFAKYIEKIDPTNWKKLSDQSGEQYDVAQALESYFKLIQETFEELEKCRVFELLKNNKQRADYLVNNYVKLVAMTSTHAILKSDYFLDSAFRATTVIFEESGQLLDFETFAPLTFSKGLRRMILIGDDNQLPPLIKNDVLRDHANLKQSMFSRLLRLGYPVTRLEHQGRSRQEILDLYKFKYGSLHSMQHIFTEPRFTQTNKGLAQNVQFVGVDGQETCPLPHFYQNLQEAEYSVALYMYLRLVGYLKENITILTTYRGQQKLIKELINKKCAWHEKFGRPHKVTVVDRYQGQQNDIVILSLVRSKHVGFIKDQSRMVVALSRARLGLYIIGNSELFKGCREVTPSLGKLLNGETQLILDDGTRISSCNQLYSIVAENLMKLEE